MCIKCFLIQVRDSLDFYKNNQEKTVAICYESAEQMESRKRDAKHIE